MPRWISFRAFLDDVNSLDDGEARQALVDALLNERRTWPWIETDQATFVFSRMGVKSVALNLDTIPNDPPFAPMRQVFGTTLWYVTYPFAPDDLLDYLLAVDDPMTPLKGDPNLVARIERFWQPDPLNPKRIETAHTSVSVLQMPGARPFPDWSAMTRIPRGHVADHPFDSERLGYRQRRLWVYTPPGYEGASAMYPLIVMHDGQWAVGPLQMPYIADALIKHRRLQPCIIAMIQSGNQDERNREYISSDRHYEFLIQELLPFVQTRYRIDPNRIGIMGVAVGAIAAAHAAILNPAVFSSLAMISPPLGKGQFQDQLQDYNRRFSAADRLPKRIFQSVGRYESPSRFLKPAEQLYNVLQSRKNVDYRYTVTGSGHGLVGFRGVLPEALAFIMPGEVTDR